MKANSVAPFIIQKIEDNKYYIILGGKKILSDRSKAERLMRYISKEFGVPPSQAIAGIAIEKRSSMLSSLEKEIDMMFDGASVPIEPVVLPTDVTRACSCGKCNKEEIKIKRSAIGYSGGVHVLCSESLSVAAALVFLSMKEAKAPNEEIDMVLAAIIRLDEVVSKYD